jgi:hypothetical protein
LPDVLATATPGAIVGPVAEASSYWVAEILSRTAAQLDEATHTAVKDQLIDNWLAAQRVAYAKPLSAQAA